MDRRVSAVLEGQRRVFESLGCVVEDGAPDFSDADEIFQAWRAWRFELRYRELIRTHRPLIKDTVIWNTEQGMALTGPELGRAEVKRTELYHRVRRFMERHAFLVCTTNQVPPFPIEQRYVTEIDGQPLPTYIDWMKSCWTITITGLPAISVPGGFTDEGLPVGLQIVGRTHDDFGVLQLAHAYEQATGHWKRRPTLAQ
jgi:amidase